MIIESNEFSIHAVMAYLGGVDTNFVRIFSPKPSRQRRNCFAGARGDRHRTPAFGVRPGGPLFQARNDPNADSFTVSPRSRQW